MAKRSLFVTLALALALCLAAPAAAADKEFLRMFSGPEGGSWYPLGLGHDEHPRKKNWASAYNFQRALAAAWATARLWDAGRADLGWSYTHTTYNAFKASGKFNKKNTVIYGT
jgi:TRAP-type uncharacterized transport system substrate-binding protein